MANSPRRVIPREQLTAWERWELGSIHDDQQPAPKAEVLPEPVEPAVIEPEPIPEPAPMPEPAETIEEVPVESVPLPTAEELEAIRLQAHSEGFEAGLEQGRLAAEPEVAKLADVLHGLEQLSEETAAGLAESVLDLALVLARQLVRTHISADRASILPVIREALAGLPTATAPSRLYLSPDDLPAIRNLLGAELTPDIWQFLPDPQLGAGECRIETPASKLDLPLAARWSTQLRVLGRARRPELGWDALPQDDVDVAASAGGDDELDE